MTETYYKIQIEKLNTKINATQQHLFEYLEQEDPHRFIVDNLVLKLQKLRCKKLMFLVENENLTYDMLTLEDEQDFNCMFENLYLIRENEFKERIEKVEYERFCNAMESADVSSGIQFDYLFEIDCNNEIDICQRALKANFKERCQMYNSLFGEIDNDE